MADVPAQVEAGITDFTAYLQLPDDRATAHAQLSELVAAFRATVGRS
jgi:hypothetical protein